MPKLHQIIAIEKNVKNECNTQITAAYHDIQKTDPFQGISRTYRPKDEDGEQFPPENKKVQKRAQDLLNFTSDVMTKYWDTTLTKDRANCDARADVKLEDGTVILADAPVTFLLFLDKQLTDLATMIKKLPVLDPGESWDYNPASAMFASKPSDALRAKKVARAFVKAAATEQHPAQVDVIHDDVIIGTWTTIKYSGAMQQHKIDDLLKRVGQLQKAVKYAREEANSIPVDEKRVGKEVFKFLFAGGNGAGGNGG